MRPPNPSIRLSASILLLVTSVSALEAQAIKALRFPDPSSVELIDGATRSVVHTGARFGRWTTMAIVTESPAPFAVLEDFTSQTGHLLIVDRRGTRLDLPKSLEPTWADPAKLYLGHSLDQIINSPSDLLGDEVLFPARRS